MSHEITLKYPFTYQGVNYAKLSFRRPKQRDIETLETRKGSTTAKVLLMAADLAQLDPEVMRELDAEDAIAVNSWIASILDPKDPRSETAGP